MDDGKIADAFYDLRIEVNKEICRLKRESSDSFMHAENYQKQIKILTKERYALELINMRQSNLIDQLTVSLMFSVLACLFYSIVLV